MTLGLMGVPLDFWAPPNIIPKPLNKQVTHATLPRNKERPPCGPHKQIQTGSIYFDDEPQTSKTNLSLVGGFTPSEKMEVN